MKTEYRKIGVTYNEVENLWEARVNGKRIIKESLKQVRKAIDYQLKKGFDRFDVWVESWGSSFKKGTVTSLGDYQELNISYKDGERSREREGTCYPVNEENDKIVVELNKIREQIKNFENQHRTLKENLDGLAVKRDRGDETTEVGLEEDGGDSDDYEENDE